MQGFKAGIHIVPHTVAGKEFRHLLTGQVLGVFIGFHTINEKLSKNHFAILYRRIEYKGVINFIAPFYNS